MRPLLDPKGFVAAFGGLEAVEVAAAFDAGDFECAMRDAGQLIARLSQEMEEASMASDNHNLRR